MRDPSVALTGMGREEGSVSSGHLREKEATSLCVGPVWRTRWCPMSTALVTALKVSGKCLWLSSCMHRYTHIHTHSIRSARCPIDVCTSVVPYCGAVHDTITVAARGACCQHASRLSSTHSPWQGRRAGDVHLLITLAADDDLQCGKRTRQTVHICKCCPRVANRPSPSC